MKKYVIAFLVTCMFFLYPTLAAANLPADAVELKVGEPFVYFNGEVFELQVEPRIIENIAMVPVRFIVEALGAEVSWNEEERLITIKHEKQVITLQPEHEEAYIDGSMIILTGKPLIENGTTLLPLRFLAENMNYQVDFDGETKEISIYKLPPQNQPPVARFVISQPIVAQGETVIYEDRSYDPDGDQLVEYKWTGKERAFFKPGRHTVTLSIKDSLGAWSEPYSFDITVTNEVKMDNLTYNLHHPLPGEPVDITSIPVIRLQRETPLLDIDEQEIMISNSPEIVKNDGILYSDYLTGENRLYYHHINGSSETKNIYLLVKNSGHTPASLTLKRWGTAGPSDPMSVGRTAVNRYFSHGAQNSARLVLQPGEIKIINQGTGNIINPGEATNGIYDIKTTDQLFFAVVALGNDKTIAEYENLPLLTGDGIHIRGTYPVANRIMSLELEGTEPTRLVLADGIEDAFIIGEDRSNDITGISELIKQNKGNYGVVYSITITSKQRVGIIFTPRGGMYTGAGQWDGRAFNIPNRGILNPMEGAMIGVIEAGESKELKFIPPAGSYLPVNLIFVPF